MAASTRVCGRWLANSEIIAALEALVDAGAAAQVVEGTMLTIGLIA